jgi:tetratricopeptide (TPR) repeat protein
MRIRKESLMKICSLPILMLAALGLVAFLPAQETSTTPVAPQPQPKSQKEIDAIMAIMNAVDPDSRIKACEELVRNFADTQFKAFAMQMAAISAQQKNDNEQVLIYGERTLEADPNNYTAMVIMAATLAQTTREFDLDKEEKLKRSEAYANNALKLLETAPRPNPNVTDQQWEEAKKDFRSQALEALGIVEMVRKNYDKAIAQFKTSVDVAGTPNAPTKIRLGAAYNLAGKHDEAIKVLDEVMADAQLHPQLRSFAQAERLRAVNAKEAKKNN